MWYRKPAAAPMTLQTYARSTLNATRPRRDERPQKAHAFAVGSQGPVAHDRAVRGRWCPRGVGQSLGPWRAVTNRFVEFLSPRKMKIRS